MSDVHNRAGRKYIVDRIIERRPRTGASSIMQGVSVAVGRKDAEELRKQIENMGSDGIISPGEKQVLKREWGNLESSFYKTQSQFQNDPDLSSSAYWNDLMAKFSELDSIMQSVFSDMDKPYVENDVGLIDDLFYDCWIDINGCATVFENSLDFDKRYRIVLLGDMEFNDSVQLTTVIYNIPLSQYTSFPASEFAYFRTSDNEKIAENTLNPTFTIDDLDGGKSCSFYVEWRHPVESSGEADDSVVKMVSFFTLSIRPITQYQWSNAADESDLNKSDSAWSDVKPVQPDGIDYLWERRSDDNGVTWLYFRNTGLIGPQGPQGPMGWSSYTAQLYRRSDTAPEPFDGGTLTFTFSTRTLTGDKGSWSDTMPAGGGTLWVIYGSFLSQSDTDTIQPNEWTSPAQISTEGTQGESGLSVATMFIYQRAEEKPPLPTADATYSFTSGILSGVSPWSAYVPSGSGRCWISTATISTRTDSAVIPPSKWSEPEIFIEPAEPGVGIESTTTEYAVGTSWTTPPETGWSSLMPVRQPGQVLWLRSVITYTDGSTETVGYAPVTGDKGDSGTDAPNMKVQYAWGSSNSIEPAPELWTWDDMFFVFDGLFVGTVEGLWAESQPEKPQGTWYLWMRTSSDDGQTWSAGQCISGDTAVDFRIEGAGSYVSDRGVVTDVQTLDFVVNRINGIDGTCVFTLDEDSVESGLRFQGDAVTAEGDSCKVVVPIGFRLAGFVISATIGGLIRDMSVRGQDKTDVLRYYGVFPKTIDGVVYDKPDPTRYLLPFRTGDHYTYLYIDEATGEKVSTIYAYVDEKPGTDKWVDTSDPDNEYSALLDNAMFQIVMDALWDMASATATDGYQPANSGKGWILGKGLGAFKIVAESMYAQFVRIQAGGALYGGDFNGDGTRRNESDTGFHIAENGLLQAINALIYGRLINSSLTTEPVKPAISSAQMSKEYSDTWDSISNMGYNYGTYYSSQMISAPPYGQSAPVVCEAGYGGSFDHVMFTAGANSYGSPDINIAFLIFDRDDNTYIGDWSDSFGSANGDLRAIRTAGDKMFMLGKSSGGQPFYLAYYRSGNSIAYKMNSFGNVGSGYLGDVMYRNGTYVFIGSSGNGALCIRMSDPINGGIDGYVRFGSFSFDAGTASCLLFEYGDHLYGYFSTSGSGHLFRSADNGASWTQLSNSLYPGCTFRNSFVSGDYLYKGIDPVYNLASGYAMNVVDSGFEVSWAKKIGNDLFVCTVKPSEFEWQYVADNAVLYMMSSEEGIWRSVLEAANGGMTSDLFLDLIANICLKYDRFVVSYQSDDAILGRVSYRNRETFDEEFKVDSWPGTTYNKPRIAIDNGEGLGMSFVYEYGIDACDDLTKIYDYLSDVNSKISDDNTGYRRSYEPLSKLSRCTGTLVIGNRIETLDSMQVSKNHIVFNTTGGRKYDYNIMTIADIEIRNLVISPDNGVVSVGNIIPITDDGISIGTADRTILALYLNMLDVRSIFAGNLPSGAANAIPGYVYVDSDGTLKMKLK